RLRRRRSVATAKDKRLCSTLHQPVCNHPSESAKSAGNEITSVRFDFEFWRERFTATRNKLVLERDDDFADMLSTGHEPKSRIDVIGRKSSERQWMQSMSIHEISNFSEHVVGKGFVAREDRIHGDDVERCVRS